MSWSYRSCLKPDSEAQASLTGEMQSFEKVSTNFFPLCYPVWFWTYGGKEKKKPYLFVFWQHTSHVTLNLWRFPILSDRSLVWFMLINPGAQQRVTGFEAREKQQERGKREKIFFLLCLLWLISTSMRESLVGASEENEWRRCWNGWRVVCLWICVAVTSSSSPCEEVGPSSLTSLRWPWKWKSVQK